VIIAEPGDTPVTRPDPLTILAIAGLLLAQDPPVGILPSVVDDPLHIVSAPVITDGLALTVTSSLVRHPVFNV